MTSSTPSSSSSSSASNDFPIKGRGIGAPLTFEIVAECGRARASIMQLPHHQARTPIFMPVGTQASVKGLTTAQLEELDCDIVLANTYHVGQRPGGDVVDAMGGLHNFMHWPRNHLTDSGGFQMVSLLALSNVTEEGVRFRSPHDGNDMLLTPEQSIHLQNQIGADIIMQLDDVVSSTVTGPRVEEAMHRSIRWLDRCIAAHKRPTEQNLFGIIQGGLDPELRRVCLREMIARDLPGYAIGGLSGGEAKESFWKMVDISAAGLPTNKPRYLMGVGYPVDLVVCTSLGVDMFDCVYPSRTARFGTALVDTGILHLKSNACAADYRPIDEACSCYVCRTYSRAYLYTIAGRNNTAGQLLTYHNIAHQMRLMRTMREAIIEQRLPQFVREFMARQDFETDTSDEWKARKKDSRGELHGQTPIWVKEALMAAGIEL